MSEYQHYECLAIDRPLDPEDMAALRQLTTRAEIPPTRLCNVSHWDSFRGDPRVPPKRLARSTPVPRPRLGRGAPSRWRRTSPRQEERRRGGLREATFKKRLAVLRAQHRQNHSLLRLLREKGLLPPK